MKILNISQHFEIRGGSDVYFHELTNLLKIRGYEVDEFATTLETSELYPKAISFENPSMAELIKYFYNRESKTKLEHFISARKGFNLAHLHIYYGKLTASILAPLKKNGIPIVQTLHEYKLVCPTYKLYDGAQLCVACKNNNFYHSVLKKCNRGSMVRSAVSALESYVSLWCGSQHDIDHFISVSDFQKGKICEMGISENKITTIHNFVSLENKPAVYSQGDYVLYFGRLEKVKGIEVLMNAFKLIPPHIKLVIAGEGEFKEELLKTISESQGLKDRVSCVGFKQGPALSELINNARFVVVPSIWYETFGLSVVEAMAYFKPVIGSAIGGISEIILDGTTGYLVPPNDEIVLARKITELWENISLTKEMGLQARKRVNDHFSPEVHYDKIATLYGKFRV